MSTDKMNPEEEQAFAVFIAAVERYVASVDEAAGEQFEVWLDEHAEVEDLLPQLLQTYPKFGEIFAEEVEKLGTQTPDTTPTANVVEEN
jgi:molybdopterin converting factor small subunit